MAHVLIVGAGPGGASLAHLLAHRGVDVTLLERQRDFAREFRGEVLVPSGVEALEQIGVAPALAGVPSVVPQRLEIFFDRRPTMEFEFDPELLGAHPPRAFSQPALLEMLVGEASKSGRLRFERGATVKDLLWRDGRVVGVRARLEGGEESLVADLVVGADGRASVVRRRAELAAHAKAPPMDVVWFKVACPPGFEGARFHVGRGHLAIGYRSWDGRLQVAWAILKGAFGDLRAHGIERWVEEMGVVVAPDWAEHFRNHIGELQHPFLLDTVSDCVERWGVPGALVIGDAAHTMSPVGAQGLNLALRDAVAAANHLVPVLTRAALDRGDVDAAGRAFAAERMREIRVIQRMQALPPRLLLSRAWWSEPVRRLAALGARSALPRLMGLGPLRFFLFGTSKLELRV
jgi:2-polyprenyl-6-methoxyphenol hydroxylase-like FAD-dependent oxidoreductase